MKFEVLLTMNVNIVFFCDVMPSELVDRNKLEGPSAFIFRGMRVALGCWYLSASLHSTISYNTVNLLY